MICTVQNVYAVHSLKKSIAEIMRLTVLWKAYYGYFQLYTIQNFERVRVSGDQFEYGKAD